MLAPVAAAGRQTKALRGRRVVQAATGERRVAQAVPAVAPLAATAALMAAAALVARRRAATAATEKMGS